MGTSGGGGEQRREIRHEPINRPLPWANIPEVRIFMDRSGVRRWVSDKILHGDLLDSYTINRVCQTVQPIAHMI